MNLEDQIAGVLSAYLYATTDEDNQPMAMFVVAARAVVAGLGLTVETRTRWFSSSHQQPEQRIVGPWHPASSPALDTD